MLINQNYRMKEKLLMQGEIDSEDEAHRELLLKGLAFIRPLTRGARLVDEAMLQRNLKIDFASAQWLLRQLQQADIARQFGEPI